MILEAIITTLNADGTLNVAPMGPRVEAGMDRFVVRPFRTSTTYRNLTRHGQGVLHVTDDVLLFARTAIGAEANPPTRPALRVDGRVIVAASRYYEFRIIGGHDDGPRSEMLASTVHQGRNGELFGFNRAKHAVIEAAILATRCEWLPVPSLEHDFEKYLEIVEKTGGTDERVALQLLESHVRRTVEMRGESWRNRKQ